MIYHLHMIYPYAVTREELLALAKIPNAAGLKIKEVAICREVVTEFAPSTFDIRVGDPGALVSIFDEEDLPVLDVGESEIIITGLNIAVTGLKSIGLYCVEVGSGGGGSRITAAVKLDDEAGAGVSAYSFGVAASDESTAITTGLKLTFHIERDFTLSEIFGGLSTVSSSGNPIIDVKLNGASIFTTNKIRIDAGEETSLTAATPPNITTANFEKGDKVEVVVDTAGTGAKGLKIYFIGTA